MNASTTEARFAGIAINEAPEVSAATRLAQYNMLNEIPGAIFGIITVAYLVGSLIAARALSHDARRQHLRCHRVHEHPRCTNRCGARGDA